MSRITVGLRIAWAGMVGVFALARQGMLTSYLRSLQKMQPIVQVNLFLALAKLQSRRQLSRLAWKVAGYRLLNDLDFAHLPWTRFQVCGLDHLDATLARGRGAILCTQHLGPYRRIFFELLVRGYRVHVLVDQKVAATFRVSMVDQLRRQGFPEQAIVGWSKRLQVINAEEPAAVRQVFAALQHNELLLVYLDGNTGVSAPGSATEAPTNSVMVQFFGQPIRVRRGVCQIAHATGAGLLPLFAHWEPDHSPVIEFLAPCQLEPRISVEAFCQAGMQQLFQLSEAAISRYPDQYEEWMHVHRWRLPNCGPRNSSELLESTAKELTVDTKRHFRLNPARVLLLAVDQRPLLVDRDSGRMLVAEGLSLQLLRYLTRGTSLDKLAGKMHSQFSQREIVAALARLKTWGLLEEVAYGT